MTKEQMITELQSQGYHVTEPSKAHLAERLDDEQWAAVWWHTDDIQEAARMGTEHEGEDDHKPLSDDEALVVLKRIIKGHDANVGINWEVIQCSM
jgi:hypothetical protein